MRCRSDRPPLSLPAIAILAVLLPVVSAQLAATFSGQDHGRMLMAELEGNRYVRRDYDAAGELEGQQRIEAGAVVEEGEEFVLPLSIVKLDADGVLRGRSEIRLRCDPSASGMTMSLLLFSGGDGDVDAELESSGEFVTYPVRPADGERLEDVRIRLGLERGALSFLGGRAGIELSQRRISRTFPGVSRNGGYVIVSEVTVRTYVLFLRVDTKRFRSEEWIDPDNGLTRHVVKARDGSYTVLQRVDEFEG